MELSERRRVPVGTVAAVARRGTSGVELELGDRVLGRSACGRDRHGVGGQAEVFEDVCGDPEIRDEREHAQGIAAARTLGDLVAEDPAQQLQRS